MDWLGIAQPCFDMIGRCPNEVRKDDTYLRKSKTFFNGKRIAIKTHAKTDMVFARKVPSLAFLFFLKKRPK